MQHPHKTQRCTHVCTDTPHTHGHGHTHARLHTHTCTRTITLAPSGRAQPLLLLCAPDTRSWGRPLPPQDYFRRQDPRAGRGRGEATVLSIRGCCVSFHRCSEEKTISCWWLSRWQESSLPDGWPLPAQTPRGLQRVVGQWPLRGPQCWDSSSHENKRQPGAHCEDRAPGWREGHRGKGGWGPGWRRAGPRGLG